MVFYFCKSPFSRYVKAGLILAFFLVNFPLPGFAEGSKNPSPPSPKKIEIHREFEGDLSTVNKGAGLDRPPYIRVFHTMEGLQFQISEFGKIRNRDTKKRSLQLSRELSQIDFKENIVIGIFSFPTDNYDISVHKVVNSGKRVEVHLTYNHTTTKYQILPSLNIYYRFLVIGKTRLPVVLEAKSATEKKSNSQLTPIQTVFGKLRQWEGVETSMGLVTQVKNKKFIYYIREPQWMEKLKPYMGKTVEVKGTILQEQGSIYEAEIKIMEIVKVNEKNSRDD